MTAPMKRYLIQPRRPEAVDAEWGEREYNLAQILNAAWDCRMEDLAEKRAEKMEEMEREKRRQAAEMYRELARDRTRAGQRPAGVTGAGAADHGRTRPDGPDKANVRATPRSMACMSNKVISIGRQKRSLIRRPEPVLLAAQSLNAMRVLFEMLFHVVAKRDDRFKELSLSIPDLSRACGLSYRMSRIEAGKVLNDLCSAVFTTRDANGTVWAPYMAIAKLDDKTGIVHLKLNDELRPYLLLDLQEGNFRKLHRSVFALRSVRSMLLYMQVRTFAGFKSRRKHGVPLAELKSAMFVHEQLAWATFHKDYLEPAVQEINRKTETKFSYAAERGGRTDRKRGEVEAVIFEVAEKETGKVLLIQPRKKVMETSA